MPAMVPETPLTIVVVLMGADCAILWFRVIELPFMPLFTVVSGAVSIAHVEG